MYNYGLVGNCQVAALIDKKGSIDWLCLPHPAGEPVFGKILDADGGSFAIEGVDAVESVQHYLQNTNILSTEITCQNGSKFLIRDFCPRFEQYGRMYRPASLFRIVTPVFGSPSIRVRCNPVNGWAKQNVKCTRGNSHISFDIQAKKLKLHTNMPLTYLVEQNSFALQEELIFALSWESSIEDDLRTTAFSFLERTERYWNTWLKHCSIPSMFQKETIRSALTLKLHCYEDTGAILAGLTTSLPEKIGSVRNWDYRFCWLRDAYFSLTAFQNLGHFEEMEGFLKFLLNIAAQEQDLAPVYALDQSLPLPEMSHDNWSGFENSSPVRSNNQAAEHVQNDVYGELVLALAPIFLDERFVHLRSEQLQKTLLWLGKKCAQSISIKDAGLWELRNGWQEHTFTNLMCWAGLDRILKAFPKEGKKVEGYDFELFEKARSKAFDAVVAAAKDGSLRAGPSDESFDASLLLSTILRFPDADINRKTVLDIMKNLSDVNDPGSHFLYRYIKQDDFGIPCDSFLICTFWLVHALAKTGELELAKSILSNCNAAANHLGLFSEHYSRQDSRQLGNFPQAYSHVGLINAAFAVSPRWDEIL